MNIFVAGIHGVGKTYLAAQLPKNLGLTHTSASILIREELAQPNWSADKRVSDVEANQVALAQAVRRRNENGERLLLDGHFVLKDAAGNFVCLEVDVFRSLHLQAAILLEAPPMIVVERIRARDGREEALHDVEKFALAERVHAEAVCASLGIGLVKFDCVAGEDLIDVIRPLLRG